MAKWREATEHMDRAYRPDHHPRVPQRRDMPIKYAMQASMETAMDAAWKRVQLLRRQKVLLQSLDRLQKELCDMDTPS
jgi:hypothetical protein